MNSYHNKFENSCRVSINNLPISFLQPNGDWAQGCYAIRALAARDGEVLDVFRNPDPRYNGSVNVTFASAEDAREFVENTHLREFEGRVLHIKQIADRATKDREQRFIKLPTGQPVQFWIDVNYHVDGMNTAMLAIKFGKIAGTNGCDFDDPDFEYKVALTNGSDTKYVMLTPAELFYSKIREDLMDEQDEERAYQQAA